MRIGEASNPHPPSLIPRSACLTHPPISLRMLVDTLWTGSTPDAFQGVERVRRERIGRMIRHEVIVKIKDDVAEERVQRILEHVRELAESMPMASEVRMARNRGRTYRHVILVLFLESEESL